MLESVDSQPGRPPGRGREIETRLGAVRLRLRELRDRDRSWDAISSRTATPGERVAAAQHRAAEAHAAAVLVLVSSADAFRHAAEAHERAANIHERAAANGIGDVAGHERQAALHRAAAAADWERAERVRSLLSGHEAAPRPNG